MSANGSWQGYVQYNINSLTADDRLIELGVMTQMESQKVRKRFENLKKETFRFGLNHGDISLKNTIVNQAGQVILLDWGSAEVSVVPHGDMIQVMQCQILGEGPNRDEFHAFLDGTGLCVEDLTATKQLLLLRAFDKLWWAIDRSPDLTEPFAAYAKQVIDLMKDDHHSLL